MKLSIFSIFYLFIRIIPIIIFFFFIYQYLITFDINTLYFLIGLCLSFIIVIVFGNTKIIQNYKNLEIDKTIPVFCNTLLLTKNGPFSTLPLSQTMFGYILFFILYILIKYKLVKQNIQYIVLFVLFILMDGGWNLQNNCINSSLIFLSLTLGSSMGLLFAYIIDKSKKTDLRKFQRLDKSKQNCKFNAETNKYTCYETL